MKTWKVLFAFLSLSLFISVSLSYADDELMDLSDEASINDSATDKKIEIKPKTAIPKPPLVKKDAKSSAVVKPVPTATKAIPATKSVPTATLDEIEEDEESEEEEEEIDEDEGDIDEDEEDIKAKKPLTPPTPPTAPTQKK